MATNGIQLPTRSLSPCHSETARFVWPGINSDVRRWTRCVQSRFGVPSTIVTDHLTYGVTLLGSKRSRTTSYHPQSNGMVERFHRQLKAAQPSLDGYSPSRDSDCSAEMVYGTTLRLPGEFFSPSPTNSLPDPSAFIDQLKIESGNQSPPIETSHS